MNTPLYQVDSFTQAPFAGNPAAVVILTGPADAPWMQQVANEMNLSETAFVHPIDAGFAIRYFTPTIEVALCGHATLAAAHILLSTGRATAPIHFTTHAGAELRCTTDDDGRIAMAFPPDPITPAEPPAWLVDAIGAPVVGAAKGEDDWLLEVADEATVQQLAPDLNALNQLPRGVIVTAQGQAADFVSRFFAPAAGIPEDPVTGSAHRTLAAYWQTKLQQNHFYARQLSPRGGDIWVSLDDDRVHVAGYGVTIFETEIAMPPV